jgi:hypothetical protein
MFSMAKTYDERELSPIFEDPRDVVLNVLGREPSAQLLARLENRRGQRSKTEQPSIEKRQQALQRAL